jgi:hypothetical protein
MILLGQRVDAPATTSEISPAAWAARVDEQRALVERAYSQAEALEILHRRPDLLRAFTDSPTSWCSTDAEVVRVLPGTWRTQMPHLR